MSEWGPLFPIVAECQNGDLVLFQNVRMGTMSHVIMGTIPLVGIVIMGSDVYIYRVVKF